MFLFASGFLSGPWTFQIDLSAEMNGEATLRFSEPFRSVLYDQASALQMNFDRQHDLGGLSFAKTWGLASWGAYVASCVSYHPGDMVEYNITSGERCQVLFALADATGVVSDSDGFPWQEMSNSTEVDTDNGVQARILTSVAQQPLIDAFDCKVFYNLGCTVLLSSNPQTLQPAEQAFQQLAASTSMGLQEELNLLEDTRVLNLSVSQRLERLNHITISRSEHAREAGSPASDVCDFCSICDQVVQWVNATEAACVAGHHFGI